MGLNIARIREEFSNKPTQPKPPKVESVPQTTDTPKLNLNKVRNDLYGQFTNPTAAQQEELKPSSYWQSEVDRLNKEISEIETRNNSPKDYGNWGWAASALSGIEDEASGKAWLKAQIDANRMDKTIATVLYNDRYNAQPSSGTDYYTGKKLTEELKTAENELFAAREREAVNNATTLSKSGTEALDSSIADLDRQAEEVKATRKSQDLTWALTTAKEIKANGADYNNWLDQQVLQKHFSENDKNRILEAMATGKELEEISDAAWLESEAKLQRIQDDKATLQKARTLAEYNNVIQNSDFTRVSSEYLATHDIDREMFGGSAAPETRYLTEEQKAIFAYLAAKGGTTAKTDAFKYKQALTDVLHVIEAYDAAGDMRDAPPIIKELVAAVQSGAAGVESGISGLTQSVDRLTGNTSVKQQTAAQMTRGLISEDLSGIGKVASDLAYTVGNMAPSLAVGSVTGAPLLGSALLGTSAGGNAYAEARREGYTDAQAAAYGVLTAISETTLQSVLGGVSKISGVNVIGSATKKAMQNVLANTPSALSIVNAIGNVMGEFTEEYLQSVLEPVFRNVALGEDNEIKLFSGESLESGLLGALTAALLNLPTDISTYKASNSQNQPTTDWSDPMKQLTDVEGYRQYVTEQNAAQTAEQPVLESVTQTEQLIQTEPNEATPSVTMPFESVGAADNTNITQREKSGWGENTLTNTDTLTTEQKQRYKPETLTYESTTNAQDIKAAGERLQVDYEGEAKELMGRASQDFNSEDLHTAYALMYDAIAADGETGTSARVWMEKIAEVNANAGQVVQANAVYSHTPQGKLIEAQQAVNSVNKRNKAKTEQADTEARKITEEIKRVSQKPKSKQAKKAALAVSKAFVGEKSVAEQWAEQTAENLSKRSTPRKPKTITQIMQNDFVRFAAANVKTTSRTTARTKNDRLNDYLANTPYYDSVWQKAQEQIREKYKDNPTALAEFEKYLNNTIEQSVLNYVYGAENIAILTDGEIKEIFSLMEKSNAAPAGSYEANLYEQRANRIIASKMPRTLRNKIITTLMNNMLGNFRTLISRNVGGNLLFALPEQTVTKGVASFVDTLTGLVTKERTVSRPTLDYYKSYAKGFGKGIADAAKDFRYDIKTPKSGETLNWKAQTSSFAPNTTNIGHWSERLVQAGLDMGDRPFYEAAFAARMSDLNRLKEQNKLSGDIAENFDKLAPMEARLFALESVFQNNGEVAEGLTNLKNAVTNLIEGLTGISLGGQFAIPFTRTPGGILQRTAEYLPGFGTVKNAIRTAKEIRKGEFNQARFATETSRNIVGALLTAALFGLVASGNVTGGTYGDDDENIAELEGEQAYAVKIGDRWYSYNWIPVLGSLTAMVADFWEGKENGNSLYKAALGGLKAVTETSAMQGLNRLFGGYNSTIEGFANSLIQGTGQVVPSWVGQVARSTDEYERQTYDPNIIVRQWNSVISKIPVLRKTLPVLVDSLGKPVEISDDRGTLDKIIENTLSPVSVSEQQYVSPVIDELARLSDLGYKIDLPDAAKNLEYKSEKYKLSADEYNEYQVVVGNTVDEYISAALNNSAYQKLDDDIKALVIKELYSFARDQGKREIINERLENGDKYTSDFDNELELTKQEYITALAFNKAFSQASKLDNRNTEQAETLAELYDNRMTKAEQDNVLDIINSDYKKPLQAAAQGVDLDDYYEWKQTYKDLTQKYKTSEANKLFAAKLFNSNLSADDKEVIGELIPNYTTVIVNDKDVNYSSGYDDFNVTLNASPAKLEAWNESIKSTGVSSDVYLDVIDFINNAKGDNKKDEIAEYIDSLDLTPEQKTALYKVQYTSPNAKIPDWSN